MRDAQAAELRNDWETARWKLQQAQQADPKTPYLMSMMAVVASHDNKPDEAIADLNTELRDHPDANTGVILLLANTYAQAKRYGDAADLLTRYSSRNEPVLQLALASIQNLAGNLPASLATQQNLLAAHPENRNVQMQIAGTLQQMHRTDEAVAMAKKAIEGADDPFLINNGVYVLSEMKVDLPFAEANSRRSVDMLERRTTRHDVEAATPAAFADSATLAAAWDTLGYILLLEKKPKEAEPYLYAAWFNRQDLPVGHHLADAYEAAGHKADALRVDLLAQAAGGAGASKQDVTEVQESIARLGKSGVRPAPAPSSLQAMRAYRVRRPVNAEGTGTVRVQLGTTGITSAALVAGNASLKELLYEVEHLPISGAVPPGSSARILRDGTLTCSRTGAQCDFILLDTSARTSSLVTP